MCGFSDIENKLEDPVLTDEQVEKYLFDIYTGAINIYNLPQNIYLAIANYLTDGLLKGYGAIGIEFGTPDYAMIEKLRESVYVFSGAKTFQQVKEISSYLVQDGKVISFADFKSKVLPLYEDYNINWLQAEYQTAVASGRMASRWVDIQRDKEALPLLQYKTIGDDRVRPEHKTMDNIVKPVNDPFWDTNYPPNGWRCRCDVYQLDADDVESEISNEVKEVEEVHPLFRFNVGKKKRVFSPKHPYFKIEKEYKYLAKINFGLPLPNGQVQV